MFQIEELFWLVFLPKVNKFIKDCTTVYFASLFIENFKQYH